MPKQGFFSIFPVNELLASPRLKPIIDRLHPAAVLATIRGVYEDVSSEMVSAAAERRVPELAELTDKIIARLQDIEEKGNRLQIDATGILFSGARLTPPLGQPVLEEMIWRLDVPFSNLLSGESGEKDDLIEKVLPSSKKVVSSLCSLTGAADALLFSSPETAEIALIQTYGRRGEILIARRDLYENSSGGRFETRLSFSSRPFREIGASNNVTLEDFRSAVGSETGLIWLASGIHSDLKPTLGTAEIHRLSETVQPWETPIIGRFDFAPIIDLSAYFSEPIPTAASIWGNGYDLLLFGGGQLIGGPDCGILLGNSRFLEPIRRLGLDELFAPHPADLSGLARTLALSRNRQTAELSIPILQTVATPVANLQNRAQRLVPQLLLSPAVADARVENSLAGLYSDGSAGRMFSSRIRIVSSTGNSAELAELLKKSKPGICCLLAKDAIFLDLKTVPPALDSVIVRIFEQLP